jgi:arylsulfatase A-like enzyme/predicted Zn-dependent protease
MTARGRALAVAAVVTAAALAAGLWLRARPPRTDEDARRRLQRMSPAPSALNVVVVTLDTLRADRLGCYGFAGVATPNIDGLASEGLVFDRATATVPLTFPSHSSMFTGLLPPHHGIRDNGGFFLDDTRTTLAERLKAGGWTTGAFVGAWVLESRWGLAQGFDHYSDRFDLSQFKVLSLGTVQKKGDEVMDDTLRWLDSVRERKFFAWVHLYDPHTPYEPPEPWRGRYPGQPYVGEVAYTDHVVGRLLEWLRGRGLMERTLVVLTADHGESLGEHGESTHAFFIYEATTHVPLIVRTPWRHRGRSGTAVSGADLMPTVLDLVGLPPEPGLDGRSLARAVLDPDADLDGFAYSETYFPRYHFGWQHLRSLRDARYTFVDAPTPELYDRKSDPGERTNVYKAFSRRAEDMRERMGRLVREEEGKAAPERQGMDPDTLQRLAALGYVGNVADVDPTAVLPDPKDKVELFAMMGAAKQAGSEDRLGEAIDRMKAVLARDPGIMDAHLTLGNWLARADKPEEAIEAFKQALSLKPDDEVAMLNLANAYRNRGRPDDALAALDIFRGALKVNPKNPQAWYQLATLYLDLGKVKDAEQTFREALAANPKMGAALNSLGVIAFQAGRVEEAETLVRQAREIEPDLRTSRYNLARVLEARGDLEEAERAYRDELATYPDHGRARFNLAQLLRQRGDRAGYLAELRQGVEKADRFGPCYFFLAREELGAGRLEAAADLARRGLEADGDSEVAPLGHYVLADVYNRRGERDRAREEVGKARRLEAGLKRQGPPRL